MQTYKVNVSSFGTIRWYNEEGQAHRLDGPAVEYSDGAKFWFQNGVRHRLDGPAAEYSSGTKYWLQNNKFHRLDGPAIEYADGTKFWYLEGVINTEEEYWAKVNPVKELTIAEISALLGYEVKVVK